jgi:hypothetical protein
MKENKLTIRINKPWHRVFELTINPEFTPEWIDTVEEEKAEYPIKIGTIYKNKGKDGVWNEYIVSDFQESKVFELKSLNSPYVVCYTYARISDDETELTYHEWMTDGEIAEPFEMKHLNKLKEVLEK